MLQAYHEHKFKYEELSLHYVTLGSGRPLLLLHGWGTDLHAFDGLMNHLATSYKVIALDFPGFGLSTEPTTPWGIQDYAKATAAFCDTLALDNPIILGHSFGARVALILAASRPIEQMILTGAAGLRPKRTLKWYLKVYSYKALKRIASLPGVDKVLGDFMALYQKNAGSADYKNATPMMKQILSRVVGEDLGHLLPQISASTLLIWGENDTATPLKDGERMEADIPDSGLAVIKNAGHYAFLDQPEPFKLILDAFLKEETATC